MPSGTPHRFLLAVDLCFTDEGLDVELTVDADLAALTAVWLGRMCLADAIAAGSIRLDGDEDARALFGRWFGLSPFADGGAERILAGNTKQRIV